jgi:hypothetical protein
MWFFLSQFLKSDLDKRIVLKVECVESLKYVEKMMYFHFMYQVAS